MQSAVPKWELSAGNAPFALEGGTVGWNEAASPRRGRCSSPDVGCSLSSPKHSVATIVSREVNPHFAKITHKAIDGRA